MRDRLEAPPRDRLEAPLVLWPAAGDDFLGCNQKRRFWGLSRPRWKLKTAPFDSVRRDLSNGEVSVKSDAIRSNNDGLRLEAGRY